MKSFSIVRIAPLHYGSSVMGSNQTKVTFASKSYAEQQRLLFEDANVYGDGFSRAMCSLGHDAHEIVFDSQDLQETWARERGIQYPPGRWQYEIVLAQIKELRPEVVYFQGPSLPYSIRKNLKTTFPFIKLIVAFRGYPGAFGELADVDVLLAGSPIMVERYRKAGLAPLLLYHSFDDGILQKVDANGHRKQRREHDFSFVGSSGFGYGLGHQSRYWALVELAERTDIVLWIHDRLKKHAGPQRPRKAHDKPNSVKDATRKSLKRLLENADDRVLSAFVATGLMPRRLRRLILEVMGQKYQASERDRIASREMGQRLPTKPLQELFPQRCNAAVFGIDMYRTLANSKVVFNCHTDAADSSLGNMRMFEATGVGACLLTDTGDNMSDLFEEDREVVTYSSIDECIGKLSYLLEHDDVRAQIAAAGQRRTLRDHTVMNRCQQIDEILQKML